MDFVDLSGRQVLVIGGTGFVGSRLVEKLVLESKARVRVLVRNFSNAVRIARLPVEMVSGDVLNPSDIERVMSDCEIVFHCVYGNSGDVKTQRRVTVDGTRNSLDVAVREKVKRFVYLSTLSVYGIPSDGDLDESAPHRYSGTGGYADSKLEAEKVVWEYVKKYELQAAVLQPTVIYGPYGPLWTVGVLNRLKGGGVTLIDEGNGFCNAVYIDDVINAILLAAVKDEAAGEAFLISAKEPITWRDFYGGYERMLGIRRTASTTAAGANAYYLKTRRDRHAIRELKNILREDEGLRTRIIQTPEAAALLRTTRRLLPDQVWRLLKKQVDGNAASRWPSIREMDERPLEPEAIPPLDVRLSTTKTRVIIDKAKRMLGYQPVYDFEAGMSLTEKWAQWAGLLDRQDGDV